MIDVCTIRATVINPDQLISPRASACRMSFLKRFTMSASG
jgi:hypothetical protein